MKLRQFPQEDRELLPLLLLVQLAPFGIGLFFEWFCALASLVLLGWLAVRVRREGLCFRLSPGLVASAALLLGLLGGGIWGVDRGAALLGVVKFLPAALFALSCATLSDAQRERLLAPLPYFAAGMVLVSVLLGQLPALEAFFYYGGSRLTGFFQYPNSFAAYLLLGVALSGGRERLGLRELGCLAVLGLGVALTHSRAVAALLGLTLLGLCLLSRDRRKRLLLAALLLVVTGLALYLAVLRGGAAGLLERVKADRSLLGRLLFWHDALPVILRHPLGLGYLGYWFRLGSFQTGAYSAMHAHNALLELLLDAGWIPAGLFVWATVQGFRRARRERRVALAALVLHSLFDFDMQFVSLLLFLLLLLDTGAGRPVTLRRRAVLPPLAILAALSLWLGTASALYAFGLPQSAAALYPGYSQAQLRLLAEATTVPEMEQAADALLSHNSSASLAWSARARVAFSRGDFAAVIDCKRRAIALSRYSLAEYLDYADMLRIGEQLYTEGGDTASAVICREEARRIPSMLDAVLAQTHPLAWQLETPPSLALPADYAWLSSDVS